MKVEVGVEEGVLRAVPLPVADWVLVCVLDPVWVIVLLRGEEVDVPVLVRRGVGVLVKVFVGVDVMEVVLVAVLEGVFVPERLGVPDKVPDRVFVAVTVPDSVELRLAVAVWLGVGVPERVGSDVEEAVSVEEGREEGV